jgi:chlorobactene glucosyltransferase
MADGNRLIRCRMYRNWPEVRDGYAKNILAGYGGRVSLLVLATLFHWLLFVWPWLWLVYATLKSDTRAQLGASALIVLGLTIRALSAASTHQRIHDALLMPLSVILMTRITVQALWWHFVEGGPSWKGRTVRTKSTSIHSNEQP